MFHVVSHVVQNNWLNTTKQRNSRSKVPSTCILPKVLMWNINISKQLYYYHFSPTFPCLSDWLWLDMPNNHRICFFIVCKSQKWQVSKISYSLDLIGKNCFVHSCPFPALGLGLQRLCSQPCRGLGAQTWALLSLPTDKPSELAEACLLHQDWEKEGGEKKGRLKEAQHKKKASDNTWPRIMKPDRKPKQPIIKAISLKPDGQLQRKNFMYNKEWQKPARHRREIGRQGKTAELMQKEKLTFFRSENNLWETDEIIIKKKKSTYLACTYQEVISFKKIH